MPVTDTITDLFSRIGPQKGSKPLHAVAGGGASHFDDDMIVSKPAIIFHTGQIFFNFISMACFASVAAFQAKWGVGPSGLSGFTLFVTIAGMFLSTFMLLVPVIWEKYSKLDRLARALKEVRVSFILTTVGTVLSLLIAFIVTISAFTQPGCKDASKDPHAKEKGKDFQAGLDGWCATKKAASVFLWLAFGFWLASFVLLILDWRNGKLHQSVARDQPFAIPQPSHDMEAIGHDEEDDDDEHSAVGTSYASSAAPPQIRYDPASTNPFGDTNRYSGTSYNPPPSSHTPIPAAGRPSVDAYGAFDDPAPSGYGTSSPPAPGYASSPSRRYSQDIPEQPRMSRTMQYVDSEQPRVSRTMQYADPYAAVKASLGGQTSTNSVPPSYESYQGYR